PGSLEWIPSTPATRPLYILQRWRPFTPHCLPLPMCRPMEPRDTASALSDTGMASTLSDIIMASAISDTGMVCLRMVTTTPMNLMASTTSLSFTTNMPNQQSGAARRLCLVLPAFLEVERVINICDIFFVNVIFFS
ncbi:unnamed protein product, partial [Ixodes persulcatus]